MINSFFKFSPFFWCVRLCFADVCCTADIYTSDSHYQQILQPCEYTYTNIHILFYSVSFSVKKRCRWSMENASFRNCRIPKPYASLLSNYSRCCCSAMVTGIFSVSFFSRFRVIFFTISAFHVWVRSIYLCCRCIS